MNDQETGIDLLMRLPKEISLKVLTYLSGKQLSIVCQVSKNWRDLANYNLLWKKLCLRETVLEDSDCVENEISKENVNEESDLDPICKWAQIYHRKVRLLSNWASDTYTWLAVDHENPYVDVYHNKLAAVYWIDRVPTVDILNIADDSLQQVQTLSLPFNLEREALGVFINDSVLIVEISNISVIYSYENDEFMYEQLVIPNFKIACPSGEEQEFVSKYHSVNFRSWILCLAGRYLWYQASTAVIIYDRYTKTFQCMDDILQVVTVEIQRDIIAVQCPHSVRVYYIDGKLLYNYSVHANLYYTSLVMSSTSFAFLQSEDFSDSHVVQVELNTWKICRILHLKVYKIALYKSRTLLLSQDPFAITSMCEDVVRWENTLRGTKYLRPGKDFFTVICSRYLFVCPSLVRLDMFSLYDVNTGHHLYDTSLNTSSYNIQCVANSCLIVQSKKTNVNIRSYV